MPLHPPSAEHADTGHTRLPRPTPPSLRALLVLWHLSSLLGLVLTLAPPVPQMPPASAPRPNPLLRYRNKRDPPLDQCLFFHETLVRDDLCRKDPEERVRRMRDIYMFDTPFEVTQNVNLYQLFLLNKELDDKSDFCNRDTVSETCIKTRANRFIAKEKKACIIAPANSASCTACFHGLWTILNSVVTEHYLTFTNAVLGRIVCDPTREELYTPFSSMYKCVDCKARYQQWLLLTSATLWKSPPCSRWCINAELSCPDFNTIQLDDYAGLPSFRCRDVDIEVEDEGVCQMPFDVPDPGAPSDHSADRTPHCPPERKSGKRPKTTPSPSPASSPPPATPPSALLLLCSLLLLLHYRSPTHTPPWGREPPSTVLFPPPVSLH